MRIYCSGPMTGLPDGNIPAFNAVAEGLRAKGHFVINPAEISALFGTAEELTESFRLYYDITLDYGVDFIENGLAAKDIMDRVSVARSVMDADLAAVRSCDAIYILKGWENSRGAKKELAEAIACRLQVMLEDGAVPAKQAEAQETTTEATCPRGKTTNMGCVFCYDGVICSETGGVCPYYNKEEEP